MASVGSLTCLRGLCWNASRGPSEYPAHARHTPPHSSRPPLQATAGSTRPTGGPRAERLSDSSTPSVAGAMTTFRSRMRWWQCGHAHVSTCSTAARGSPQQPGPWHPPGRRGRLLGEPARGDQSGPRSAPSSCLHALAKRQPGRDHAVLLHSGYSTVLARGGGTSAARRSTNTSGSKIRAIVPSDQGRLSLSMTSSSCR